MPASPKGVEEEKYKKKDYKVDKKDEKSKKKSKGKESELKKAGKPKNVKDLPVFKPAANSSVITDLTSLPLGDLPERGTRPDYLRPKPGELDGDCAPAHKPTAAAKKKSVPKPATVKCNEETAQTAASNLSVMTTDAGTTRLADLSRTAQILQCSKTMKPNTNFKKEN